jgi:glycosyltransferase involved in cell wall biosynthesis
MAPPFITVLIDTYNYGRFLEEAIDSVLQQDFPEERREILVVDDGSTDDTAERVKKYGARIKYLNKPNGGQASAFNVGFQHARGEIVAMLDGDDYWLPGKLRRVVDELQANPDAAMLYHPHLDLWMEMAPRESPKFVGLSGFLPGDKAKLLRFVPYPTSCLAFRRQLIERLLPIPEALRLQADGYLSLLAVLLAPVVSVAEPLAVYRRHGRNLYYGTGTASVEHTCRQIASNITVLDAVDRWARMNSRQLNGVNPDPFLWRFLSQVHEQGFYACYSRSISLFLYLIKQNYRRSHLQTWKFTALNYLAVPAGLIAVLRQTAAEKTFPLRKRLGLRRRKPANVV